MGGFGAEPGQVQQKVPEKVWEVFKARSGSTGFRGRFAETRLRCFQRAWLRSTLQKDCKHKTESLLANFFAKKVVLPLGALDVASGVLVY